MARPLRYIPPNSLVEVTTRTIQSRLLLRPSPEVNHIILGVLGRALTLYKVELCAFVFMSNHLHLLAVPANAAELAGFMAHVKRNISEEIGRLHDWRGPMWDRRYRAIVVADDNAQVDRMRYVCVQGCKEGLIGSPGSWPGVHCIDALIDGEPLSGTWLDRRGLFLARRTDEEVEASDFETVYGVPLSPLPCWRHLSEPERRERCAAIVREIEERTASVNEMLERQPVGADFVRAQDPHSLPRSTNRSPAPLVHASSRRTRELFRAAYRLFVDTFRRAAERLRQGEFAVAFPLPSFPPSRPFVGPDAAT